MGQASWGKNLRLWFSFAHTTKLEGFLGAHHSSCFCSRSDLAKPPLLRRYLGRLPGRRYLDRLPGKREGLLLSPVSPSPPSPSHREEARRAWRWKLLQLVVFSTSCRWPQPSLSGRREKTGRRPSRAQRLTTSCRRPSSPSPIPHLPRPPGSSCRNFPTRFCRGRQLPALFVEQGWVLRWDWGRVQWMAAAWQIRRRRRCLNPSHSFLPQLGWSCLTSSLSPFHTTQFANYSWSSLQRKWRQGRSHSLVVSRSDSVSD